MKLRFLSALLAVCVLASPAAAQKKALFDNAHAETAGNSDWVIDGNTGNTYDLANYDVLVLPEPNTVFTAAEKTAIFAFLQNGGGIVAVADHSGADRNNDGWDAAETACVAAAELSNEICEKLFQRGWL